MPSAGLLVASNLATGTATVTVTAGGQTMVTFFDTAPVSLGGTALDGPFQVRYAAHLDKGESWIDIVNTGANGDPPLGPGFGAAQGNLCVNAYVFDAGEELIACCSCLVTPNAVVNLGVNRDLTVNTIHVFTGTSVTVKLLATLAGIGGTGTTCTNSAATATRAGVASGMAAFGTTIHAANLVGQLTSYVNTETPFLPTTLSDAELASITSRCAAILGNGSDYGICSACRSGALGADRK